MLNNFKLNYFYEYLIIFFFVSFIFLFSISNEYFQARLLILLLLFPCSSYLAKDLKEKNYRFIKYMILFFSFFFLHLLFAMYLDQEFIKYNNIFVTIYLLSLITISYYLFNFFNSNILKIIKFFILIFFLSSLSNIYEFKYDAPYFCGGVPDLFNFINFENEDIKRSDQVRLSFKEYIFKENSHLGMVAPGIIIFLVYYFFNNKTDLTSKIFFGIFFILCFIKNSTTFLVGTSVSLIILLIFNYKNLDKKTIFSFSVIILIFSSILIVNKECNSRFIPVYKMINTKGDIQTSKKLEIEFTDTNKKKYINKLEKLFKTSGNLSSATYFHSFNILKESILDKPLGWGLNRYNKAFEYVNKKIPPKNDRLNDYNKNDGTNNFVKIFVEFGIFGIFFYLCVYLFMINKSIPIELKLFYLPIVISQSIRGAGYFNGGFILIAFLMLFTYIDQNKKIR